MDNNNYSHNPAFGMIGLLCAWAFVAFNNILAFTRTITLDDIQRYLRSSQVLLLQLLQSSRFSAIKKEEITVLYIK